MMMIIMTMILKHKIISIRLYIFKCKTLGDVSDTFNLEKENYIKIFKSLSVSIRFVVVFVIIVVTVLEKPTRQLTNHSNTTTKRMFMERKWVVFAIKKCIKSRFFPFISFFFLFYTFLWRALSCMFPQLKIMFVATTEKAKKSNVNSLFLLSIIWKLS